MAQVNALPELQMVTPEATYPISLGWIDASQLNVGNPTEYLEQHGLGFSPGRDFGDGKFVRCNFGCTRSLLEQAVERLQQAVSTRR